jgi:hypothetical protein
VRWGLYVTKRWLDAPAAAKSADKPADKPAEKPVEKPMTVEEKAAKADASLDKAAGNAN